MSSSIVRVLVALSLVGCLGEQDVSAVAPDVPSTATTSSDEPLPAAWVERDDATPGDAFDDAEARFDVPAELLLAIASENTGHQMVQGEIEFEGQIPVYGVMALPDDVLDEAAALADVSVEDAMEDRAANILATAALLDAWAEEEGLFERGELGAWAPVVARYSGIEDESGQALYVHGQVYQALQDGIELEGLTQRPLEVQADFAWPTEPASAGGGDRSYALWRPSPNHSSRPSGASGKPAMVVIHTCEGSYSGCVSWLRNGRSRVSAHYVVNNTGSEVSQLVAESRKAWHISATYQCSRNNSTDCWRNGGSSNNFTVGIEHAGYSSQSSWHSGLIDKSARLTCDITKSHGIPRDAYHIVGHGKLQPYNRTDPGKNWPWSTYLSKVKAKCGSSGGGGGGGSTSSKAPSGTRVIDSNNRRNDTANQKISVSGSWRSSASVGGYYGTGYWWRATGSSSDSARFRFRNTAKTCYKVQAWWPAASDRSRRAPWVMQDPAGKVIDKVIVDQRTQHARWVTLGTYDFPTGWNTVSLSRWTSSGRVVVADAVRLVPSTGCASTSKPKIDFVVDNANGRNDTSKAKAVASSSWTASRYTSGYYGSNYAWGSTDSVSDGFSFQFKLPERRRVTLQARWTAGGNRSTEAPFLLWSPSGTLLDKVIKNQQKNGGRWVTLGTWTLPAGWNRVDLSRWAPKGYVVVADAIRVQSVD